MLYQRLTRVISKLTDGVEAELQKRMDDLDNRARQSAEKLEQLAPQIGRLSDGLEKVGRYLSEDLDLTLKKASESAQDGLQHAENLQHLLSVLLANVLESNSQLAFAHEQSLQQASQRVNDDMEALMAVVSTAIASSSSLQQQIVGFPPHGLVFTINIINSPKQLSSQHAALLAQRQDALEQDMDRVLIKTEALSTKLEDHSSMLKQANNITNDILDALEETAAVASSVNQSFFMSATTRSWWPFVVFPAASLVMGSYGLPPSIMRNLGLLALGEAIGFIVSSYEKLTSQLLFFPEITTNTTVVSAL